MRLLTLSGVVLTTLMVVGAAGAATPGESLIAMVHAEGAQIYECKTDEAGKLTWQFREPIATLFDGNRTVGWHAAGPVWEMSDGSSVGGKVVERFPGASADDIPLLELAATSHDGDGVLAGVLSIERRNTRGGVAAGPCATVGAYLAVPYSADYAFYGVAGDVGQGRVAPPYDRGPYDYLFRRDETPLGRSATARPM